MGKRFDPALAELLMRVHRHAWRVDAPPLDLTLAEVTRILPNLIQSGSVGIVWPRLRHRAVEYGAAGLALEAAYRAQVEHNRKVERDIARVVGHLRAHGIDPVLVKGFAMARLYPEGLVRPAGDIDLVVRDEVYERAMDLLAGSGVALHGNANARLPIETGLPRITSMEIDLHSPSRWEDDPGPSFFSMAKPVGIGGVAVMVPSNEDHLAALTLHFLRHGAVRYVRLMDIALLVESSTSGFDWDRCLRAQPPRPNWIATVIGLAHHLLGARVDSTPIAGRAQGIPAWLPAVVGRQIGERQVNLDEALAGFRLRPEAMWRVWRQRWPDPITATVRLGLPFERTPRLPIQWYAFLTRLAFYLVRTMPRQVRRRMHAQRS